MGILEIHFHDSEFSWSVNPGTGEERSLSLGTGGRSGPTADDDSTDRTAMRPKLRSAAILALVIAGGIAFNRVRSRRARRTAETETTGRESQGPFSRLRSR